MTSNDKNVVVGVGVGVVGVGVVGARGGDNVTINDGDKN